MALGDKLPVVMGKEKAVANGVATLGTDGKLAEEQRPSAEDIGGVTAPALPGVEGQLFGVGANGLTEWITQDAEPTENSTNPVQSGGVYTALAGKADTTLSNLSNYQKALHNIGGRPNRNLLDNWYFVGGGTSGKFPINQRGQTSYPGLGYAIDRWRIPGDGGTLTVNQNGITYQNTTENTAYLSQFLELSRLIPGRQHTMSALFAEGSAAKAAEFVCYRPGSPGYSVFTGNAVEGVGLSSVTFTVPEDTTSLEARLITGPFGTTGDFTAVAAKLELGDHQTLAYQDDEGNWQLYEIPDYAEELAKCQRYLYVANTSNMATAFYGLGFGIVATETCCAVSIPEMRLDIPSVSFEGNILLFDMSTTAPIGPITNISVDRPMSAGQILLRVYCEGVKIGEGYLLIANEANTRIVFSAEL